MLDAKCKKCKLAGEKLFLKGDKCFTPKCPLVKSAYAKKGAGKKRRRTSMTAYGKQLREKQKVKTAYGMREKQFRHYVKIASSRQGSLPETLATILESRMDSVVFRLGFTPSRTVARQLINHGHFFLNGRRHDIASTILRPGDVISIRPQSKSKAPFKSLSEKLKTHKPVAYLKLDSKKLEGTLMKYPDLKLLQLPFNFVSIVEFYSR